MLGPVARPSRGRAGLAGTASGPRIWCQGGVQGFASVPEREVGGILNVKQGERREVGAT